MSYFFFPLFLEEQKALDKANDLKAEGNKLFVDGKYEDALLQYALALQIGPEMPTCSEFRSMCHANSAACYSKLVGHSNHVFCAKEIFNFESCIFKESYLIWFLCCPNEKERHDL